MLFVQISDVVGKFEVSELRKVRISVADTDTRDSAEVLNEDTGDLWDMETRLERTSSEDTEGTGMATVAGKRFSRFWSGHDSRGRCGRLRLRDICWKGWSKS